MSGGTKTAILIIGVVFAAAVGCGIGCAIALKWSQGHVARSGKSHTVDDHLALHKKLELREDQKLKMEALEEKFAKQVAELFCFLMIKRRSGWHPSRNLKTRPSTAATKRRLLHCICWFPTRWAGTSCTSSEYPKASANPEPV